MTQPSTQNWIPFRPISIAVQTKQEGEFLNFDLIIQESTLFYLYIFTSLYRSLQYTPLFEEIEWGPLNPILTNGDKGIRGPLTICQTGLCKRGWKGRVVLQKQQDHQETTVNHKCPFVIITRSQPHPSSSFNNSFQKERESKKGPLTCCQTCPYGKAIKGEALLWDTTKVEHFELQLLLCTWMKQ